MDIDDVVQDFETWLRTTKGSSPATCNKYIQTIRHIVDSLGSPDTWDADTIYAYHTEATQTLAQSTCNVRLAALKAFIDFSMKRKGKLSPDLIDGIHFQKVPKRIPRNLDSELIREIETSIEQGGDKQDRALFELLYGSGLRRSEAGSLRLHNFESKDFIRIVGKGDKERRTTLTDAAYRGVREIVLSANQLTVDAANPNLYEARADELFWTLVDTDPETAVFRTTAGEPVADQLDPGMWVYDRMRSYGDFSPHQLRHTWATELLAAGADSMAVKDAGGWDSWKVMEGYRKTLNSGLLRMKSYHPRQKEG